jgi:hypothetical protein
VKSISSVLVVACALALAAAACGGGDGGPKPLPKKVYVKQMQAIGHGLSNSLNGLSAASGSPKSAATALQKVQQDLRDAAERLDKITPPKDIKKEQDALTTGVRDFADELDPVIKKVKSGKIQALATLTTLKGVSEIQKASTAITNKGYKIGA